MPMGKLVRSTRPLNRRQVKQVQKIVDINKKLKQNWTFATDTIDTTGYLLEFTAIPEGDDFNQRSSDKIRLQSIRAQLAVRQTGVTPSSADVRVMIVRGKFGPLAVGNMPAYNAEPDLDRMQVYYDFITTLADVEINPIHLTYMKKFRTKKVPHISVNYDDDVSGTAAQNNPLYLYAVGSTAANAPFLRGYIKAKWFDAN